MPWSVGDVDRFVRGLTPAQKRVWVAVANAALARCEAAGEEDCEGRAIRQATAVARRAGRAVSEAMLEAMLAQDEAFGPRWEAVHTALQRWAAAHALTVAADPWAAGVSIVDLYPDVVVFRWRDRLWRAGYTVVDGQARLDEPQAVRLFYVDSGGAMVQEVEAPARWFAEAVTKTEDGREYTAADYVYVPDPEQPSTWKLRVAEYVNGEKRITARQVGRAVAALSPGGFRGNRVELPASAVRAVKARLRRLWRQVHGEDAEMPPHLAEAVEEGQESADVSGVERRLHEVQTVPAVEADGTLRVCLITPGWGSSGYYPAEVLERDGPRAFPAFTQMYWDHPTEAELQERPEGSLTRLAGVLVTAARWEADGPCGPGLYADARVFGDRRALLQEMAPYIGVSINAAGVCEEGEADGRAGWIVRELVARPTNTVDFVTRAGRGGRVVTMVEAWRGDQERVVMEREQEVQKLQQRTVELEAAVERLQEELARRDAWEIGRREVARYPQLGERARERVLRVALAGELPLTEARVVDAEEVVRRVQACAQEEVEYLATELQASGGVIRGMGAPAKEVVAGDVDQRLRREAQRLLGGDDRLIERFVQA